MSEKQGYKKMSTEETVGSGLGGEFLTTAGLKK